MSRPRRTRSLTAEERRIWAQVARGVTPLCGRALPEEPEPEPPAPAAAPPVPAAKPRPALPRLAPPVPPQPPLAPLERKLLLGLRRGARDVDAVLDLHGLRQAEAHQRLIAFLLRAQALGHGLVLVVTGKGGVLSGGVLSGTAGSMGAPFEERGVLRRVVPHWLRLSELRSVVLGFEEAGPPHGGSGALYVRLRRRAAGRGMP